MKEKRGGGGTTKERVLELIQISGKNQGGIQPGPKTVDNIHQQEDIQLQKDIKKLSWPSKLERKTNYTAAFGKVSYDQLIWYINYKEEYVLTQKLSVIQEEWIMK